MEHVQIDSHGEVFVWSDFVAGWQVDASYLM